jgi:hypothetical protein
MPSITRAGDTSGGGSSSPISLPSVSFGMVDLQNRGFTADYPNLHRYRMFSITIQMGGITSVAYGTSDACSSSSSTSVTSANTDSCYPVYWTPRATPPRVLDWFESYMVTPVTSKDATWVAERGDRLLLRRRRGLPP